MNKVAINTAAIKRPEILTELSKEFGRQCVVLSIQARRIAGQKWEAMCECGREKTGLDIIDWIQHAESLGVGEILVTSVDQDGTLLGPDYELINKVSSIVNVPFIYSGGIRSSDDILDVLNTPKVCGAAIGASLHKRKTTLHRLKSSNVLGDYNQIAIRDDDCSIKDSTFLGSLSGLSVGIIDYGMGNQQSLINAFNALGATPYLSKF